MLTNAANKFYLLKIQDLLVALHVRTSYIKNSLRMRALQNFKQLFENVADRNNTYKHKSFFWGKYEERINKTLTLHRSSYVNRKYGIPTCTHIVLKTAIASSNTELSFAIFWHYLQSKLQQYLVLCCRNRCCNVHHILSMRTIFLCQKSANDQYFCNITIIWAWI